MWSLQLKIKIEIKSSMQVFPGGAVALGVYLPM